jgi:hypothetical protein
MRVNSKEKLRSLAVVTVALDLATAKQFVNEGAYVFITARGERNDAVIRVYDEAGN